MFKTNLLSDDQILLDCPWVSIICSSLTFLLRSPLFNSHPFIFIVIITIVAAIIIIATAGILWPPPFSYRFI